jgi:hypothetical protein
MPGPRITSPSWFNQEPVPILPQMFLHDGARQPLPQAIEAEVVDFLTRHANLKTRTDGSARAS